MRLLASPPPSWTYQVLHTHYASEDEHHRGGSGTYLRTIYTPAMDFRVSLPMRAWEWREAAEIHAQRPSRRNDKTAGPILTQKRCARQVIGKRSRQSTHTLEELPYQCQHIRSTTCLRSADGPCTLSLYLPGPNPNGYPLLFLKRLASFRGRLNLLCPGGLTP
jgi:hypothetical protein